MEIKTIRYRCLPCALQEFTIDGKEACTSDFGSCETTGSCMDGTCCNRFIPAMPTQEVLDRYGITLEEYAEITEELKDAMCVDGCGWCS